MSDASAVTDTPEKPVLRPANQNPWYLLATLHGEQPAGADFQNFDGELHAKNCLDWNRYMATIAKPKALEAAKGLKNADGSPRIPPEELVRLDKKELEELEKRFRARGGNALPKGRIDFRDTAFTRAAMFSGFWFEEGVDSDRATFSAFAGFDSSTFSEDAAFKSATFSKEALFESATFSESVTFESATFSEFAWFKSANFSSVARFDNATFFEFALFENGKFQSSTSFAHAKFRRLPPKLHGATLHEGTMWHGVVWPPEPTDPKEAQRHVYNYERLKQEMERLKKHDDELDFFAREMRAKRVVDGEWSAAGLLNWAYDAFSAYGRSVWRPFRLLGFWMLLSIIIENTPKTTGALPSTAEAYGLSLANCFAILPFVKDAVSRNDVSALVTIVGVLQGGLGALMLFLIGLALRNRFRLR